MERQINPYLAFDDRKFIVIGAPLIAFLIPVIFFGMDLSAYLSTFPTKYPQSLAFCITFWLLNRETMLRFRRHYDAFASTGRRMAVQFLFVLIMVPVVSVLLSMLLQAVFVVCRIESPYQPKLYQALAATYFLTLLIWAIYESIYFFHMYREAIREKDRIQMNHIQGQLDNLRNQINPHFLFNSLNTLMSLIPTDTTSAMSYLSKLSKFYRYTVSNQEETLVPLREELENVGLYVELLQERFKEGIDVSVQIPSYTEADVLPLCLQLLIENAVKHNIVSSKRPLCVDITLEDDGQYIQVANNKQLKIREVSSTGMGLRNIQERVAFFSELPVLIMDEQNQFSVAIPLIYKPVAHERAHH
ncbi:MAG: histidine kinase [Bacteroidota bacterium]